MGHDCGGRREAGRPPRASHILLFCSMKPRPTSTLRTSCSSTTSRPGSPPTSSANHQTGTSKSSAPLAGYAYQLDSMILSLLQLNDSVNITVSGIWCPPDRAGLGELNLGWWVCTIRSGWCWGEHCRRVCAATLAVSVSPQVEHDSSNSQRLLLSHQERDRLPRRHPPGPFLHPRVSQVRASGKRAGQDSQISSHLNI